MQGPVQPSRGRRAGDPGTSGQDTGGLKEWQRNTWYGPAPLNDGSPFEEPESAPELLEARSSNVSNHTGSFWTDQGQTGYQYPTEETGKQPAGNGRGPRRKDHRERSVSVRAVIIVTVLLAAAFFIVWFGVFRIREIRVVGNREISSADIIRFSGIRKGGSILQLSEKETEKHLNAAAISAAVEYGNYNYYRIQFRYLEKELPGTVTIAVREREACCFVTWCGIIYVMDKSGMVLYETEDTGIRNRMNLVEVKGLDIRSGAHVGQTMVMSSAAQKLIFTELFLQMKVRGCTDQIREADLSNPYSILLTTRDNFTVSLGDGDSLNAKLKSMMLVREKLAEMEITGGSINVSSPESPSYSPDSPQ